MASMTRDEQGKTVLQFFVGEGRDRRRRTLRLTTRTIEDATTIKAKIEALIDVTQPRSKETADWVKATREADPQLYDRLSALRLVPSRNEPGRTVAKFLDGFIASRKDWKPSTRSLYTRDRDELVEFFGAETPIASITPYDADEFRRAQRLSKAESTVRKTCSRAKTMFQAAVRKRLIEVSPFADMRKLAIRSAKKFHVTREMADKVLDACVDNQWKLIFALCRFGGLRCTSEVLRLRWGDVNWQLGRITVHSPKTEHHEGGDARVMPLFPELRPHLQAVLDELLEKFDPKAHRLSEQPVITRYRKSNANLRTQLERTIKAAGLTPWPVLFNSLRASRVNELRDQFPDHVVNAWMGHSQKIAERHYLQPTDEHFAAATAARGPQNCSAALQSGGERADSSGPERTRETEFPEDLHYRRETESSEAPPVGLEGVLTGLQQS